MNTIYKLGDKVYDAHFGWGEIIKIDDPTIYPIQVKFNSFTIIYTIKGFYSTSSPFPSLSFTKYDFTKGGFSQERPEELPNKGDIVWVKEDDNSFWQCKQFMKKTEDKYKATSFNPFDDKDGDYYEYMTTKNPYTNE